VLHFAGIRSLLVVVVVVVAADAAAAAVAVAAHTDDMSVAAPEAEGLAVVVEEHTQRAQILADFVAGVYSAALRMFQIPVAVQMMSGSAAAKLGPA
jgi:hypothetical protein